MATWTDIPDASLEPGAPARSVDALALRDNDVFLRDNITGPEILGDRTETLIQITTNTEIIPQGTYYFNAAMVGTPDGTVLQIQVRDSGGTWRAIHFLSDSETVNRGGILFSDGVNVRALRSSGTRTWNIRLYDINSL